MRYQSKEHVGGAARRWRAALLTTLLLPFFSIPSFASADTTTDIFQRSVAQACAERHMGADCHLLQVTKEHIAGKLWHYRALVQVGPHEYDVIGLNRVVREPQPELNTSNEGSFFFLHGSNQNFRASAITPGGGGLAIFLAERNIDVWGIDLRNVQLPINADPNNLPDASAWNYDMQIRDIQLATRAARFVRALTGQGRGGLILGGHSLGGSLTYAVANAEAVVPPAERDITAIIPMDFPYKLPSFAIAASDWFCGVMDMYDYLNGAGGPYFFDSIFDIASAKLAQNNPNGISPYDPTVTNLQLVLRNAGASWFPGGQPMATHAWSVLWDPKGLPYAGRFTRTDDILRNMEEESPYIAPMATLGDMFRTACLAGNSAFDKNLGDISIPVLYIWSAAGFGGSYGTYTLTLLGSEDKTSKEVKLLPDSKLLDDFGHMDVVTAVQSRHEVFQPIHAWIMAHSQ